MKAWYTQDESADMLSSSLAQQQHLEAKLAQLRFCIDQWPRQAINPVNYLL